MTEIEMIDGVLARVDELFVGGENDEVVDLAKSALVASRARIVAQDQVIIDRNVTTSTALRERDTFRDRAEQFEKTLRFWQKSEKLTPFVGLACDGPGCDEVISLVCSGAKPTDEMYMPIRNLSLLLGWEFSIKYERGDEIATRKSWCPACATKVFP